jgi:hypothetical protein
MPDGEAVTAALSRYRIVCNAEAELQAAIADAMRAAGLPCEREVPLTPRDRIDLLVDRVGIEVKVAGSLHVVARQLQRYAASDRVDELVLVTTKGAHARMVDELGGKPVSVHVVRAW